MKDFLFRFISINSKQRLQNTRIKPKRNKTKCNGLISKHHSNHLHSPFGARFGHLRREDRQEKGHSSRKGAGPENESDGNRQGGEKKNRPPLAGQPIRMYRPQGLLLVVVGREVRGPRIRAGGRQSFGLRVGKELRLIEHQVVEVADRALVGAVALIPILRIDAQDG